MADRYTITGITTSADYAIPSVLYTTRKDITNAEAVITLAKKFLEQTPVEYNEHYRVEVTLVKDNGEIKLIDTFEK